MSWHCKNQDINVCGKSFIFQMDKNSKHFHMKEWEMYGGNQWLMVFCGEIDIAIFD